MKKVLRLTLLLIVIQLISSDSSAQQVLFNVKNIDALSPCQGSYSYSQDFQFYPIGAASTHPDSALVRYNLFNGLEYDPSSVFIVSNTGGDSVIISEYDISDLNEPVFLIRTTTGNPLSFGQSMVISFTRSGDCSVANIGAVSTEDSVIVSFQGVDFDEINGFDVNDPSIVLSEPSPFIPDTVQRINVDTICMPIEIRNAGLGDLKNMVLTITLQDFTRNHTLRIGDTVLSFGASPISVELDFMQLASNDTSLAGVLADSNLVNGESLIVYHCFTVISCSPSFWDRTYTAYYGCNSQECLTTIPFSATRPMSSLQDESVFTTGAVELDNFNTLCNNGTDEASLKLKYFFSDTASDGTLNPFDSVRTQPRIRLLQDNVFYLDTTKLRAYYASNPAVTVFDYQDIVPQAIRNNVIPAPCGTPNAVLFSSNDFYTDINLMGKNDTLIYELVFIRCPDQGQTQCTRADYSNYGIGDVIGYIRNECNGLVVESRASRFLPRTNTTVSSPVAGSSSPASLGDGDSSTFCYNWDFINIHDNQGRTDGMVEIIFPAGITGDTSTVNLSRNGSPTNSVDSVWLSPSGDTMRVYDFDIVSGASPGSYQLCIKTNLTCGALPTGYVENKFSFSSTTTVNGCSNSITLNHVCEESLSFFIACNPSCSKGLIVDEQRIERKNFGYADPDNDNWYDNSNLASRDSSGVRADRVMAGDTLCAFMSLGIKTDGDDISTIMIEQQFDNGEYYEFAGATITVFDSSTSTSFSSTSINAPSVIISVDTVGVSQDGNWETFRFTIDVDPFSPGFLFEDGDSIQLDICWKMRPVSDHFFATGGILDNTYIDASTLDYTLSNIATASYIISKAPAVDTAICPSGLDFNTITEVSSGLGIYPYGNDEFETDPVPTTVYGHPCQGNITMSLYSYVGTNTQDVSAFPNEIRPVVKLDTVYFDPDSIVRVFGVYDVFGTVDSVTYWVERLTIHNSLSTSSIRVFGIEEDSTRVRLPILGPAANGLNYVVVNNNVYKDAGGTISVPFENNMHRFKFHVSHKDDCNFTNANLNYFRYPIFANVGWEGLNVDTSDNYSSTDRDASLGGAFYARPFMSSYFPRLIDIASQNVLMNTTSKSITSRFDIRYPSPNPFMFIEYDTSKAEINFVISSSTGGDTLYPVEYANGAYLLLDTFMPGDRNYTINYSLTSCDNTTLNFMAGASCDGISDPNTLEAASACTRNDFRILTLIPTPSNLQAQIYDQPRDTIKLCELDTIGIKINSAGNADIIDPYIHIPIQPGIEFNEISVTYLDSTESLTWDTVGTAGSDSIRIILGSHSLLNDSLPGSIIESDTLPRLVSIDIAYGTTCDVVSGGTFKIVIFGDDPCGGPSLGSGAIEETTPVNIVSGASYNFITLPSPLQNPIQGCSDTVDYTAQFSMLPDKDPFAVSNGKDTFSLILPQILNYIPGTFSASSPDFDSSFLIFNQYIDTNGNDSLVVSIPAGINLGEGFTLNFQFISNTNGSCGVSETIFSKISGSSNSTNPICFSPSGSFFCANAIEIQRGTSSQTITIEKSIISDFMVASYVRDTILDSGDEVAFEGTFKINNQDVISGDSIKVDLYCLDNLGSRIGSPITSYSFSGEIVVDSVINFSDSSLTLSCPGIDSIVAVISTVANDGSIQCICDSASTIISYTLIAPPIANPDNDSTSEDTPIMITVIANDSLPDSTLANIDVTVPNQPNNGTVTVDSNGVITYVPDSNFVGVDTITYVVCDSSVLSSICDTTVALVTVFPVIDTASYTIPEDSLITICLDSLTNLQGGISSTSICGGGNNGSTVSSGGNCFTYTPDTNFNGSDTLCLIACNGLFCDTSIITLSITPVNDPPVAVNDDTTTMEDTPVVIDVIGNDIDIEGPIDSTSVTIVAGPTNGTVTVDPLTGEVTYTPGPDYVGIDMFTYAVCDTGSPVLCDTATVTINVTPVTDTTLITVIQDSSTTFCTDSLVNIQGGPPYVLTNCGYPSNGNVSSTFSTCITYAPTSGYIGMDTMCVYTCNLAGICDTTIFVITVVPKPLKTDTIYTIDSVVCVDTTEIPGGFDTINTCDGSGMTSSFGTVTFDSLGCVSIVPNLVFGSDTTCVVICNSILGVCDTTIIINYLPPTNDTVVLFTNGTTVDTCLSTSQLVGNSFNYSFCNSPSHGVLSNTDSCFRYLPISNQIDSSCVIICDEYGICDTTYFIYVPPQTHDTIFRGISITGSVDTSCLPTMFGRIPDSIVSCSGSDGTLGGISFLKYDSCIVFPQVPALLPIPFLGDTACVIFCENISGTYVCDTTTIIYYPIPEPDTIVTLLPQGGGTVTVCADTTQVLGNNLTYSLCKGASAGIFNQASSTSNCYTYIPLVNQIDTTCVIVCDENGICDTSVFVFIPPLTNDTVITQDTLVCVDTTQMPIGHQTITGCDGNSPTTTSNGGVVTIDPATGCVTTNPSFGTGQTDTTCIIVCDTVNSICDTTVIVTVQRATPDTIIQHTNGGSVDTCLSTSELLGSTFTYSNCGSPVNGVLSNDNDTCFTYIPINNNIDSSCVIICDEYGICDTTYFYYIPPVTNDTVVTTDTVVCVDTNDLLGVMVDSIVTCDGSGMSSNGGVVTIDPVTGCVTTTPDFTSGNTDTTCVVVCKSVAGVVICDTTIIVTVQPPTPDTIIQLTNGMPTDTCLAQPELLGTMFTYSSCRNPTQGVLTNNNDTCFNYTPINNELDTSCVVICDEFGICDTTLFIYVPPVTTDTVYTLDTNVCVDTTELPGTRHTMTTCDRSGTTNNGGTVTTDVTTGCVTISPVFNGKTDTTCIIICDTVYGICDTTYIINMRRAIPDTIVECIPRDGQANDSNMNTNDLLGPVTTISVFNLPAHGQFTLTNDTNSSYQTSPFPILDTVQVSFCDEYNFCDTFTFIYIPPMTNDTIYTQGAGLTCLDTTEMPAIRYTSIETCDGMNMTSNGGTVVPQAGGCVYITPDFSTSNVDTTCVVLCDTVLPMCECDTTYVISFKPTESDTFAIQLPKGTNTADTCLTTSELFGTTYTYRRLGAPTPHGPVTTHNDTCINYVQTSTTKYLDTARVLICDEYGNCDTTVIIYVPTPDPDTLMVGPVIPVTNVDTCVRLESTYMVGHYINTCDSTGTTSGGVPVTITGLCVRYPVPAPVFTGDTACIIVCDTIRNITICDTTLIVYLPDTTPPTVICKDDTVYLNNLGTVMIDTSNVLDTVYDNTLVHSVTVNPTMFNCSNVGPNFVTVTATDTNRNVDSCISTVTVLDTLPPTAICQNITIQLDSNGNASITALDVDGGSIDNCAIASMVVSQTSFDCSHLGMNTVTLTVTDIYGNVATCTATVTVEDNIAPIAYCPGDKQIVVRNTTCSYILPDYTAEATAWDNCLGNGVTITQTPAAGSEVFLENTDTTITITATDGSGNTTTCSFQLYARCVKELNIPQFISPDGNGRNDTWEIPGLVNYPDNTVKVFNRWGNLVFEQKGYYTGWDGRANINRGANRLLDNKMLPEGTYFYIIDLGEDSNFEPYVGYMQIKR